MDFITLMPHLYAIFLTLLQPWEMKTLRKRLENRTGDCQMSVEGIDSAVFETTMGDFWKAPIIALISTMAVTLTKGNTLFSGISVFLFIILLMIFNIIRSNLEPYHLNRPNYIFTMEIQGRYLLVVGKIFIILVSLVLIIFS